MVSATDDLSLDHETVDAQLTEALDEISPDPWLERRKLSFGCSDVPALLFTLGLRTDVPSYIRERAKLVRTRKGLVPHLFAEKAGLAKARKAGASAARGLERESAVLDAWRMLLDRENYYTPAEEEIEASSITAASLTPREWLPLVDRHCPPLAGTPDAWARLHCGCLVNVQVKCSAGPKRALPQIWRDQVQAEMAVTGAPYSALVCGEEWAAWHGNDGPIRVWFVERDEEVIAEIRAAAKRGWREVERLRAA